MKTRPAASMGKGVLALAIAAVCAAILFAPSQAHAQDAEVNSVSPTAKGIVGGGFLGAELVIIPMGAAGLKPWWPYVVFGSLGAASGAVAGWAIEQYAAPPAEAELYMLAGGLALVIPALVLALNATTTDDYGEEDAPPAADQPIQPGDGTTVSPDDGSSTTTVTPPESDASDHIIKKRTRKTSRATPLTSFPALTSVELGGLDVAIGMPFISVVPVYSRQQMATFGVEQEEEVRFTVVNMAF